MEPAKLAAQLRKPFGTQADEVSKGMNKSNARVIAACLQLLEIQPGDRILEIGPGNGMHVSSVMAAADNLQYVGVDWSTAMVAAATAINQAFIASGSARFIETDAASLPFDGDAFDKVFSVNTIYFWQNPQQQLMEIRRVLRPQGILCLAFGDRGFMEKLPFTQNGFTLYDETEATALLESGKFTVLQHQTYEEMETSNTGKKVEKSFHLMRCTPQ
ncbi:MAG: methyltransferase domain-containing protein [Cyanobacteria bacterium P01_D01_bin.71]